MMEPKMTVSEAATFLNISPQAIHKRIKSKGLPIKRKQNRFYFGYETSKHLFNLKFPKKIYAFKQIKGGVGKTETTEDVAIQTNLYGGNVLVIDLDAQANLTKNALKVNPKDRPLMVHIIKDNIPVEDTIINLWPGFDLIPSDLDNGSLENILMLGRFPLDRVYKKIFDKLIEELNYDAIFVDLPAAFNSSTTAAALACDELIIPVTPDDVGLSGLDLVKEQVIDAIYEQYNKKINFKAFINKFDARNSLSHKYLTTLQDENGKYKSISYKTYVRTAQEFPKARDEGYTIFDTFRLTVAKEDMDLLTREILGLDPMRNQNTYDWDND